MPVSTPSMAPSRRRVTLALGAALLTLGLGGCATLLAPRGEVSSFGEWPSGRAPGSFVFDRLPSQQQASDEQARLEQLATTALAAAGFTPAQAGEAPAYRVQIGVRVTRQASSPWDDPLWWRLGMGGVRGPWRGSVGWGWSTTLSSAEYEREAALLIRDAATGNPLYETRARSTGGTPGGESLIGDLFRIGLAEFPQVRAEPHAVVLAAP